MKRRFISFVFLILAGIIFTGCSNLFENIINDDFSFKVGDDTLFIDVNGEEIQNGLVVIKASEKYKNQISYSSSNKGYFSYSFQPRFYRLKMYAVKKNSGVAPQTIIMQAKASVDLRTNDEINFYLSQFTVQGDSYWSLSIYADGWTLSSSDYEKVSVGIYNKSTGELESSAEIDYSSFNRDASTAEVNFAQTNATVPSLSAGTY